MNRILFFLLLIPAGRTANGEKCTARCDRLHERSIQRIDLDTEKVTALLEKQRPAGTLRDVCWRLYDRLDCLKRCPRTKEQDKYLHLNSLCLENTVGTYCPAATKVFRRLNFRDYFLTFIIPENDLLFDDVDLDSCQIYDFVKTARVTSQELEEELTTIINKWEEEEKQKTTPMTTTSGSTTTSEEKREFTTLLNELLSSESAEERTTAIYSTSTTPKISTTLSDSYLHRVVPTSESDSYVSTQHESIILTSTEEAIHDTTVDESLETTISEETTLRESTLQFDETSTEANGKNRSPSYTKKTILEQVTTAKERESTQPLNLSPLEPTTSISTSKTSNIPSSSWQPISQMSNDNTIVIPLNSRKVFSDDSMENNPPNFFYSSARYRTSTLSANHGRHLSSLEIVEPVEVDTTTLLGDDFPEGSMETESVPWTVSTPEATLTTPKIVSNSISGTTPRNTGRISVTFSPRAETGTISHHPASNRVTTPLLNGGVVVKTIKRWGESESDEDEDKLLKSPIVDESELNQLMGKTSEYDSYEEEVTPNPLSDKEILLFIYLVLFGMALLSLICVLLFCICCRRAAAPDTQKY